MTPDAAHSPLSVLVVDDEPVVCSSCRRLLGAEGFTVDTALRAADAQKMLAAREFDIVITDLRMPEITGMEMLEFVKRHYPDTQVIMITGHSTIANAVESMRQGAYDYVPKPFTPDELLTVVRGAADMRKQAVERLHRARAGNSRSAFDAMTGASEAMQRVYDLIDRVAPTDATVLITGESGTGKELIARAIHSHSARRDRPFIALDCSALAETLLESELFGHARGAFTGATADKRGIFEIAQNGTLFLDEVSNIPMEVQKKLLRVLEQREYRPVGAEQTREVDIRLIAATNRDLTKMIAADSFREDLFYRLNVFSITAPPLRERAEDIPLLAERFLAGACGAGSRRIKGFTRDAMALLMRYPWPGNVRELKNAVERLALLAEGDVLSGGGVAEIFGGAAPAPPAPRTNDDLKAARKTARENAVRDIEKAFLIAALARNQGNITRAAEDTGMQRTNFQALVKKYGVKFQTE